MPLLINCRCTFVLRSGGSHALGQEICAENRRGPDPVPHLTETAACPVAPQPRQWSRIVGSRTLHGSFNKKLAQGVLS
jgi:hypothetical protein